MGIKVEKEHADLYHFIREFLKKNALDMPISLDQFAEKIAKAHLAEIKFCIKNFIKFLDYHQYNYHCHQYLEMVVIKYL